MRHREEEFICESQSESRSEECYGAKRGGKIQKSLDKVLLKIKEENENTQTCKNQITHMNEERMELAWENDRLKKQVNTDF